MCWQQYMFDSNVAAKQHYTETGALYITTARQQAHTTEQIRNKGRRRWQSITSVTWAEYVNDFGGFSIQFIQSRFMLYLRGVFFKPTPFNIYVFMANFD